MKEQGISFCSNQDDLVYTESQISVVPITISIFNEESIINKIEEKKNKKMKIIISMYYKIFLNLLLTILIHFSHTKYWYKKKKKKQKV